MKINQKIKRYLKQPLNFILYLNRYPIGHFLLRDALYLKTLYRVRLNKKLRLDKPVTFNEKLQWLKLHNRNPIYTKMVDKFEVKNLVSSQIGEQYVIKTYGVWSHYKDIDFSQLPNQFVLKSTHDSGGVVVCRDKTQMDFEKYHLFYEKRLKRNYFWGCREWPYKNAKPQIMAEEFISDGEHENLIVYKVFCFGGEPRIIQVIQNDKQPNESIDYFDTDWKLLKMKQNFPNSEKHLSKPEKLSEMLELSHKLAGNIPFIRIDWYLTKAGVLFSEYTFYSDAGMASFEPEEWDEILGNWIDLESETI